MTKSKQTNTPSHKVEIRDTLLSRNVLTDPRIKTCGKWINPETYPPRPRQIFCEKYNCRVCRYTHIENDLKNHFIENQIHRDRGGYFFQITLTVPHSIDESFSEIYPKFIKSISNFKKGPKSKGWRKVQELTDCQYHTDNIECHQTDNGYHIHNHITLCGFKNPPIQTIYNELYNSWNYYTRKNGFRPISKKGVLVNKTKFTNHSGSMEIKSIEELTQIFGTTEYWENELHKIHTNDKYTNPVKTPQEIEQELKTRYRVTKKSRRGKINRPQKSSKNLTSKNLDTPILIDQQGNHHSINSLSNRSLYENENPFTIKESQTHIDHLKRYFREGFFCQIYETKDGGTGYKWKKIKNI